MSQYQFNETERARYAAEDAARGKKIQQFAIDQGQAQINADEITAVAAENTAANSRLNTGALAQSRRRAGGTTFRRRGSAVSANELVGGLGATNAKALAQKRRDLVTSQVTSSPFFGGQGFQGTVGGVFN